MDINELYFSDNEENNPQPRVYRPRVNFDERFISDFQFREKFRLRRAEAEFIVEKIGQNLINSEKNMALTPRQQLLVALHWLGCGSPYHCVADMHGIGKSTVCRIVRRVVDSTIEIMFQDIVHWPDNTDDIAQEFLRIGGFPSVAGCVDGTLIKIDSPNINEEQFVDRHGNHSLNCMVICGPDYSFYFISSRCPGSTHDARVLRR
ncbi:putative nuclease HARBI1 [Folsomia candida]|uniref:putative nuclease HARBI1 n=1 Tax=Folsomia candida TaxID=158441 RepID=UPI00160544DA|nr:putative nuclease HARBI1 [Folsomia candida]